MIVLINTLVPDKSNTPAHPQLKRELIKARVLDSIRSIYSRRAALGFAAFGFNVRLTAGRPPAAEAVDNKLLEPTLARGDGLVQGAKQSCVRTGNWLTLDQAERLISTPDQSKIKGKRDRAVLALMVGCGLRRSEVSGLAIEEIQQRDGRWVIIDMKGKGNRVRTVPMPAWTKLAIDHWTSTAHIEAGNVFRPINNEGEVLGGVLLSQNVMVLVSYYGKRIGVANLAPNDLRRTFAKLAHEGSAALAQIQVSLGHASIQTTERYLGVRQDLQDAPCDHLGLKTNSDLSAR